MLALEEGLALLRVGAPSVCRHVQQPANYRLKKIRLDCFVDLLTTTRGIGRHWREDDVRGPRTLELQMVIQESAPGWLSALPCCFNVESWNLKASDGCGATPESCCEGAKDLDTGDIMAFGRTTLPDRRFIRLFGWLAFSTPCSYVVHQGYIFNLRWLFPYYLHDEAAAPKAASQKTSSLRSSTEVI